MIRYPTPLAPRSVDRHFRRSVDRHFRTAPRPRADASRAQAGPRPQQIPQGTTLATTPRRSPPQNQHRRRRAASGRLVRSSRRSGQPLGPLRPYILAPPLFRLSPALQAQLCRAGTAQLAPLHAPLRAPPSSAPSSNMNLFGSTVPLELRPHVARESGGWQSAAGGAKLFSRTSRTYTHTDTLGRVERWTEDTRAEQARPLHTSREGLSARALCPVGCVEGESLVRCLGL